MTYKIKDIITDDWITMDLIWEAIDAIPDDHQWAEHKKNIKVLFKKDGTPKIKTLSPQTDSDFQTLHSTSVFIRKMLKHTIEMNRRKKRIEMKKKNIADVKKGIDVPRRINLDLTIEEPRKQRSDKGEKIKETKYIDPIKIRNELAVEYNRLIREGNPDTKKLREQIHDEIQKIENEENVAS